MLVYFILLNFTIPPSSTVIGESDNNYRQQEQQRQQQHLLVKRDKDYLFHLVSSAAIPATQKLLNPLLDTLETGSKSILECFDVNRDFDSIRYLNYLRYIERCTKYLMHGKTKQANPHLQATPVREKRKRGTNSVCQ